MDFSEWQLKKKEPRTREREYETLKIKHIVYKNEQRNNESEMY